MSRTVPIVLFAVAFAPPAPAADSKSEFSTRGNKGGVFAFATFATDAPFADGDALQKSAGWNRTAFRPNGSAVYHLYVFNPTNRKDTFTVELDAGFQLRATAENLAEQKWTRVKFAPAPAPVPAPAPAAGAAPATPAPAVEPPLPGKLLARTATGFPITLRLLDKEGKPVVDTESTAPADKGKPYGRYLEATVVNPAGADGYLNFQDLRFALSGKTAEVSLTVTPKNAQGVTPSDLKLSFPKLAAAAGPVTRDGVYHRTLTPENPKATLRGAVTEFGRAVRAEVAADGVPRAFIFEGTPVEGGGLKPGVVEARAIRVYPAAEAATAVATKPVAAFPVRVEVDNPPAGATAELRYYRDGDTADDQKQVIPLGGPRDEQMAFDVTADGIAVATRSKDWVKPLNLSDARGKVIVEAVLRYDDGGERKVGSALVVTVDDTPPEGVRLTFDNLKGGKQLEKGQPLRLSATADDLDTEVAKAVFFLGVPTDDGKPPADAVQVKGDRRVDRGGEVRWTAALPLPADKRGELTVGVIVTDSAGNSSPPEVKRIELVDAPPPGAKPGSVEGKLTFGENPQPGQTVTLADADGKAKDTTKTDGKGKFAFKDVPPGAYKLTAAKTDFSTGLAGATEVTVKPGEKATATIELKKKR